MVAAFRNLLLLAAVAVPVLAQEVEQEDKLQETGEKTKSDQHEDFEATSSEYEPTTTTRHLSEEELAELKRQMARKEFVSASEQSTAAQKHGEQVVAQLKELLHYFKGQEKNHTQVQVLKKAERHAEAEVRERRSRLSSNFADALEDLKELRNFTHDQLELAAEKVERASKEIRKLDKEKAKLIKKAPHHLCKLAKKEAKGLEKDARKSARAALHWAHHAESAGRKAGQDESVYEGTYQDSERDSEELSQDAEQYSERAEGVAEEFYEGAEGAFERRSDELNDAAEEAHEHRLKQMAEIINKIDVRSPWAPPTTFLASSQVSSAFFTPLCLLMMAVVAYGVLILRKPVQPVLNKPILG